MTLNALVKEFLLAMASRLEPFGFRPELKKQTFLKATSNGRQCLHFAFIKHKTDFDVTVDVAIRFDSLEKLLCEAASEPDSADTYSLGAELGNILGSGQQRWTIVNHEDVTVAAAEALNGIKEIGFPYLEKYSDMREAFSALSGDDQQAWLHSPVHGARAKRATALAFLLKNKEEFNSVAADKLEFLRSRNDFGIASFLHLMEYLEKRTHEPTNGIGRANPFEK